MMEKNLQSIILFGVFSLLVIIVGSQEARAAQSKPLARTTRQAVLSPILPVENSPHYVPQDIFINALAFKADPKKETMPVLNYKEKLRNALSIEFTPHLQVRLDQIKVKPIAGERKEIVLLSPQLESNEIQGARGYGIGVKVKFD